MMRYIRLCLVTPNTGYFVNSISNKEMHIYNGNIFSREGQSLKLAHLNFRGGLKHKSSDAQFIFDKYKVDLLGVSESNQLIDDIIVTNNTNYNFIPGFNYIILKLG